MDTGLSRLDPATLELCHLRLAARSASLIRQGWREAQVEVALGDLDHADLPATTIAALRLVDLVWSRNPNAPCYQRLRVRYASLCVLPSATRSSILPF
jgi:hypothetical protein